VIPEDLLDITPILTDTSILIVEDDEDSRALYVTLLSLYGARVRAVETVGEALDIFASDPPDLLVSDIDMPGADGFDLIRTTRGLEGGRDVPALAVTGSSGHDDRARILAAGFDAVLYKPVNVESLIATLSRIRP
jgi:CheY-like chemotaxis protein